MREHAAPNHSWVEVTHCSAGVATPTIAFNESDPSVPWKFISGPAWFFTAPGSGVSINVGRTAIMSEPAARRLLEDAFRNVRATCDAAGHAAWRMRILPSLSTPTREASPTTRGEVKQAWSQPLPLRHRMSPGRGGGGLHVPIWEHLDSIQILDHRWKNSAEIKSEIILLKEAECASVLHMSEHVRCGRHPYGLASTDEPRCRRHLQRMERCHNFTKFGDRAAVRFGVRKVDCNSEAVLSNAAAAWARAMQWKPGAMQGWVNETLARMPKRPPFKKWWKW